MGENRAHDIFYEDLKELEATFDDERGILLCIPSLGEVLVDVIGGKAVITKVFHLVATESVIRTCYS